MAGLVLTLALAAGFGLHPAGTLHGHEALARDGESWLALEPTAAGMRLVATRVRVAPVHDALLDAEGEASGREVTTIAAPAADLLLRGPGLRAGAVESAERLDDAVLAPDEFAAFRFRGRHYRVRARCPAPAPRPGSEAPCRVVLAGPSGEQALFAVRRQVAPDGVASFGDAATPALLHAGDFDRDGHPDLILDTTDHYNVAEPTLFLSRPAAGTGSLRAVASHRSTGC